MKLRQILAGVLSAVMVLTSVPVTANAATVPASLADTAANPVTIEEKDAGITTLASVRKDNPELGDVALTADELALLNGTENVVIDIVFKYNQVPAAARMDALLTLTGEDGKFFTVWHGGKRYSDSREDGWCSCDLTGGTEWGLQFGSANAKVQDTQWHKLSLVINKSHMYAYLDGRSMITTQGVEGYQYDNQTNFKDPVGNFVNHTDWTINGMKVGKILDGASYHYDALGNLDGVVKSVEIKNTTCGSAEETLALNQSTPEAVKADFTAYVNGLNYDQAQYTQESWTPYADAKTAADALAADDAATEWAIYNAWDALKAAEAGLEVSETPVVTYEYEEIDRTVLQENATANTEQYPVKYTWDGTADWAFDDSAETRWSSRYDWTSGLGEHDPNDVIASKTNMFVEGGDTAWISSAFGESILLGKLEYQGRIDSQKGQNAIGDWKLWTADVAEGEPTEADWKVVAASVEVEGAEKHDTFPNGEMQTIVLNTPVKATHFKLETLSLAATNASGDPHVVAASVIRVYKAVPQSTEAPEVTAAKEALQAVVDAAADKTEADYTAETWTAYQAALAAAQEAIDDKAATVESVAAAQTALEDAAAKLETKAAAAKKELQADIDAVKAIYDAGNAEGLYTAESWTAFTEAYDAAVAEVAKEDATVETLAAAKEALATAKDLELAKAAAGVPAVNVAAPAAGEKAGQAVSEYTEAVAEKLEDVAADPAALVRSDGLQIVQDGEYAAINGKVSVEHAGDTDKLMVTGNNKYLFKFMLKASEPTDTGVNHTVLQKEAGNYGLQINKGAAESKLKLYCKDSSPNGWPETDYTITDGFWDTWHEIIAMYDGSGFRLYVDGTAGTADTGRPTSFALKDSYTGAFAVGNADLGTDKGNTISVRVANVEMYTGDQVPATDENTTAETLKAALAGDEENAAKVPSFKLDAVAAREAAGSECTVESTTWTDEDNNVMGADDTFKEYTDYTMTVVLKANENYVFADTDKPATIKAGETDVPVEAVISADRTKMTLTWTYDGGEDPRVAAAAELQEVIDTAQAKFDEGNADGKYEEELWTAFETALNDAKAEVEKAGTDATVETLAAAKTNLEKALADLAASEGIEITDVSVRHYDLSAGQEAKDPLVVPGEHGTRYETIADRAANPADLVANDAMEYSYQTDENGYASWGFKGELTDNGGGTGTKFDVSGADNPLLLRFKVRVQNKEDVPDGVTAGNNEKTMQLLGKMDDQYGLQLRRDKVIIYAHAYNSSNADKWVQSECAIGDDFWGKWHEIIAVFTGTEMQLYVDGEAGHPSSGRPNATDKTVVLRHDSGSVFTTGYNKTKREQSAEADYAPFNGYLADVEMYTDKDYTEGLTAAYGAVCKALDSATPAANITLKPFSSKTDWYKVVDGVDTEIASGTTLEELTVYKAVTTLTAHAGYRFPQTTSTDDTVAIEVAEDGSTMTVTKTYAPTAELQCLCTLGDITLADQNVVLEADEAPKTITLNPTAAIETNGCKIHETNSAVYTYEVTEGNDTVATVTDEGVVTAKAVGTASIKVTATMPKKEGEEAAVAEKTITLTVTSKKATDEEKQELTDAITEAEKDLNQEELTEETYTALMNAIKHAEEIAAKANASKDEVAAAKAAVETAKANLKTKLEALKEEFVALSEELADMNKDLYTADSWNKVVDAYNAAKEAYGKADVTFEELEPLVAALKEAKDALVLTEVAELEQTKADLAKALSGAKALIDAGQKNYTDATWKEFKAAYDAAAAAPENATAAVLKELVSKLTAAQKALATAQGQPAPTPSAQIKVGDTVVYKNVLYKVTNADKKTVAAVKGTNKKAKKVTIPASVKVNGVSCTVTQINANAFKGFKKLAKATIGKNVTVIGKKAFFGCKKLKTVIVKGKSLKTIQRQAFKKTASKVTVKAKALKKKQRAALLKKMKKKGGMSKKSVVK